MKPTLVALCALFYLPAASGHNACGKDDCAKVKRQIRTLESKMRSGYSARQGERWAAKLRELKRKRAKSCR
ncbi:MAG: hypothetical protein AAF417_19970 [Pseudomonadota bacterium]